MILKDVAKKINMHESTLAGLHQKNNDDSGMFEMKIFFGASKTVLITVKVTQLSL